MKSKMKTFIKNNYVIYLIYYYIGSMVLKIWGHFIRTKQNMILFESFAGKRFDDSPYAIFEEIMTNPKFDNFTLVWVFDDPQKFDTGRAIKVKNDTLKFYYYALKAKVWIINTSIERRLSFKKQCTFCINTWHGTPIKKIGSNVDKNLKPFRSKNKLPADIFLVQGDYEISKFSAGYKIPVDKFRKFGLPRNDVLVSNEVKKIRQKFRKQFNLDSKKVILFAPTFRETSLNKGVIESNQLDQANRLAELLSEDYVILYKAHSEIDGVSNIDVNDRVIDLSHYPNLNEIIIGSDLLVSDYSSIFFDYSLMLKPMIAFSYDYELYNSVRGMYFDVRNELPNAKTMLELSYLVQTETKDSISIRTQRFRDKYVNYYGNGVNQTIDYLERKLMLK